VVTGQSGGKVYKAQNNTQTIFTDPDSVTRFQTELIAEHMTAQAQNNAPALRTQRKLPVSPPKQGHRAARRRLPFDAVQRRNSSY
jgi:hypothetical protein